MSAEAIYQVTMALKARLKAALVASGDSTGTVFVGPLDDPDATNHPLVLFLYRLAPSPTLRNSEHRVPTPPPASKMTVFQRSLALDLYYLVTVGSLASTAGLGEEPLLKALGYAMRELQVDPELVGTDGSGLWQLFNEPVHVSLESLSIDELSRIWALFPTANYRTSVAYVATPVWVDPADADPLSAPVVSDRLLAGQSVQ